MTKATVIYDADCGFCRWCLALLLTWDRGQGDVSDARRERRGDAERGRPSPPDWQSRWGRSGAAGVLRPLPLGNPEADDLLADLTEDERAASWHVVLGESEAPAPHRFSAGGALAPALSLLPGGRIPAALLAHFPRATECGYRRVADHRGTLGRLLPARARRWADRVIAAHGGPPRPQ